MQKLKQIFLALCGSFFVKKAISKLSSFVEKQSIITKPINVLVLRAYMQGFLGIILLFSVASTTGAEQIQKDDFESVVKQGYCDFFDRVGQEKFKELELEDPVEGIYQRFLNGVLIYRPNKGSDDGMVTLPIRDLANPLEGTFDLSRCGDTGNYLSISTGYRKEKKAENVNKIEIWLTPRFLVEKEINGSASHFKEIFPANWPEKATLGLIWTWGGWDGLSDYNYLTIQSMDEISEKDMTRILPRARMSVGSARLCTQQHVKLPPPNNRTGCSWSDHALTSYTCYGEPVFYRGKFLYLQGDGHRVDKAWVAPLSCFVCELK